MSDEWEVKPSPWGFIKALGEGIARAAGADPGPNYSGQSVKVIHRGTGEERIVDVGCGQDLGGAIAKGQFREDRSSSWEGGGSSSDYSRSESKSHDGRGVWVFLGVWFGLAIPALVVVGALAVWRAVTPKAFVILWGAADLAAFGIAVTAGIMATRRARLKNRARYVEEGPATGGGANNTA